VRLPASSNLWHFGYILGLAAALSFQLRAAVRCCGFAVAAENAAVAAVDHGARSRNRTGMLLPARDFKSLVSTYFTIRASVTLLTAAVAAAVNVEWPRLLDSNQWPTA
jgi:hypothetical protein